MVEFDEELAGMVNYTDETVPAQMPVMEQKSRPKAEKKANEAPVAEYVPVQEKRRSPMDRIANSAKWGGICGAISMMLWWYEVNGMMDMEAAYPWIIVCALLAGFGVGKNVVK